MFIAKTPCAHRQSIPFFVYSVKSDVFLRMYMNIYEKSLPSLYKFYHFCLFFGLLTMI